MTLLFLFTGGPWPAQEQRRRRGPFPGEELAGGEGGEGEQHEETERDLVAASGRAGAAGAGAPARNSGRRRWRTAAAPLQREREGKAGLGGFGGW